MARGKLSGRLKTLVVLVILAGLAYVGIGAFRAGPPPAVGLEPGLPGIGRSTPFIVTAEEPKRGLSRVTVEVVQGDTTYPVETREYEPLPPERFWGESTPGDRWTVDIGRDTIEALEQGEAIVRVVADRAGAWLRSPRPVVVEHVMPVRLVPPQLTVLSTTTYVRQGGSEVVVYRVGDSAVRDGVVAGDWFFPGYSLPGGEDGERFALFAVPWDLAESSGVRLVASDDVLNESQARFIDRFFPEPPGTDTIRISDGFLEKVVPPIMSQTPELTDRGDLLQNYLEINRNLRAENTRALIELSRSSVPRFEWNRRFVAMKNAKVMATFADRRTYLYDGRDVDTQVHLGFDLASIRQSEIPAANDGIVVMARYFGIYGNAVVIDHGYGLQSLYGHLSSIAVQEGDRVARGEPVGRTGATGLAGGDHLHFTMMLHGLPVNPKEWWDGHWLQDRLKLKLGDALPFE